MTLSYTNLLNFLGMNMKQSYYLSKAKNKIYEFDFVPKEPFTYKEAAEAALENFDKNRNACQPYYLADASIILTLITPCGERTFSVKKHSVPAYKAEEVKNDNSKI